MDWYVIIIILGFLVAAFFFGLQIVFYYENPEDAEYSQGLLAKIAAIVGYQLMWLLAIGVPTDAYNGNADGGLDMALFWEIVFPFILVYMMFPVPYSSCFYEADTDSRVNQTPPWMQALKRSGIIFGICAALYTCLYFALRPSQIEECDAMGVCKLVDKNIPFSLFSGVLVGWFGWIIVVLYLGVGLVALPQGLFVSYINRPKPISQDDYV